MTVALTRSDVPPAPANQVTVNCPRCDRVVRLTYTDDEWSVYSAALGRRFRCLNQFLKAQRSQIPAAAAAQSDLEQLAATQAAVAVRHSASFPYNTVASKTHGVVGIPKKKQRDNLRIC